MGGSAKRSELTMATHFLHYSFAAFRDSCRASARLIRKLIGFMRTGDAANNSDETVIAFSK